MRPRAAVRVLILLPLLAAAGWAAAAPSTTDAGSAATWLEPCEIPGFARVARCGAYEVFEDRESGRGRKIGIHVVVLPSLASEPEPDPVVFIAGGPGDSSTRSAAGIAAVHAGLLESRDILLVDLRGTGRSHPLRCGYQDDPARPRRYLNAFMPLEGTRECRRELEAKADLSLYTTPLAVDDLDEIRAALGYEKLNLLGVSYGTRAAQVYARRHPEHVRTLTLHGPVPTDARMPLTFARDAQRALDSLLDACRADEACAAAFPRVREELAAVLERLESEPATATVTDPASGEPMRIEITRPFLAQTIRYMMYLPSLAARIPLMIHQAANGDFESTATTGLLFGSMLVGANDALYLSVTCTEDVPRFEEAEGLQASVGTFLGDYRVRVQKAACEVWPQAELPSDYGEPLRSQVPTLLLVGERDPSTPPRWASEIARHLPNSLTVVVPDGGHDFEGLEGVECIESLSNELILRGSVDGLDPACVERIRRPPFALPSEREVVVSLASEELERYVGRYRSPEGFELAIEREGDRLRVLVAGAPPLALAPLSTTRFRVDGAPPGYYVDVELASDRVVGLTLEEGASSKTRLERQEGGASSE